MNNMKLSEVFEELENGSTKTYEAYYNSGTRVTMSRDGQFPNFQKFNHEGTPCEQQSRNGYFSGNCRLGLDWRPVKTSVTWQEAIQAWVDGKKVAWEEDADRRVFDRNKSWPIPKYQNHFLDQEGDAVTVRMISGGKWYVED
jgi:hypothetical protein